MQFGNANNLMKNWKDNELRFERPMKTLQRGRNFGLRSKTSFKKDSTKKDQEKGKNALEESMMCPRHDSVHPGCAKQCTNITDLGTMCKAHSSMCGARTHPRGKKLFALSITKG